MRYFHSDPLYEKERCMLEGIKSCNMLKKVAGFKPKWGKVFKNGPSTFCGKQPLKNWKGYGLLKQKDMVCLSRPYTLDFFQRMSFLIFTWSILEYFVSIVIVFWLFDSCMISTVFYPSKADKAMFADFWTLLALLDTHCLVVVILILITSSRGAS